MVDLARERLGAGADLRVASLADPLPYEDGSFDLVTCSLVLHYLQDWSAPLAELRRVLRPSGRVVLSIVHPAIRAIEKAVGQAPDADYFAEQPYDVDYDFNGRTVWLTHWHRPLSSVLTAFLDAGFAITAVTEPEPVPETPAELLPPMGRRFICFLYVELTRD